MRISMLFIMMLLPLYFTAQSFKGMPTGKEKIESSRAGFEKEVLALVNKERKKRGRKPLKWNNQLAYAARYHATDMAVDNYFDHPSQDRRRNGSHKTICNVFERMDKFVSNNIFSRAENIAVGEKTPTQVMKDWMSSSGHRRNILDKSAKYIGIGYIEVADSEWGEYWVQSFGM